MVELGCVDITTKVLIMSPCLALPGEGHLKALFHMFPHLEKKHNVVQVFNPREPSINHADFSKLDWLNTVYANERGELIEDLAKELPRPFGKEFVIRMLVDSDHAGDHVTRWSRSGFLVFLNSALIYWTSKKQTTIETSSFGSKFMAMKTGTEYLRGLRYKLRAMGIPVTNPVYVYGDNKSVLCNTTAPDSQLKKKSNSVGYHHCCEGVALDEWQTCYLKTDENTSDMMTKPLPTGEKRNKFCQRLFYFWGDHKDAKPDSDDGRNKSATVLAATLFPLEWIKGLEDAVEHFGF